MPRPTVGIRLTAEEEAALKEIVRAPTSQQRMVERAGIVLGAPVPASFLG